MESLLFMIAADIVVSTAVASYQIQAREKIVKKWKEGSLTISELRWLKRQVWFQKVYLKKVKETPSFDKKYN